MVVQLDINVQFEGTPEDLRNAPDVRREWLEVN